MTDLRDAARQALEAWEYINKYGFVLADYEGPMEQAITALKAALEQPEQEPVAWTTMPDADDWMFVSGTEKPPLPGEWHPLYTHPPRREWQGLTNPDIARVFRAVYGGARFGPSEKEFAIAVEDALKVKNNR
jgi:hypothetical protein